MVVIVLSLYSKIIENNICKNQGNTVDKTKNIKKSYEENIR